MIRIDLYDNGKAVIHKNENKEDYTGWFRNRSVGGYWYGAMNGESYEAILLDGEKKDYHLHQILKSKIKEIDKKISFLERKKVLMTSLLQTDLSDK